MTERWNCSWIFGIIAARKDGADFRQRLEALRTAHVRKPTLIDRLHKAGL